MRQLVPPALALALLVGCADSHEGDEPGLDAGASDARAIDAGERCDRDVGPIGPPFACVQGTGPICSDALELPSCVGGAWTCPAGYVPREESSCRCFGATPSGCTCGPDGWSCEAIDAGVSGGCPADLAGAEGTPCAAEGTSCGRCTDSCGFCNILRCESGTWIRLEAHPRPPPCTPFECGPELRCAAELEYCARAVSDVAGIPDDFRCQPLPPDCSECACLSSTGGICEQSPEGGLTVTFPGG